MPFQSLGTMVSSINGTGNEELDLPSIRVNNNNTTTANAVYKVPTMSSENLKKNAVSVFNEGIRGLIPGRF